MNSNSSFNLRNVCDVARSSQRIFISFVEVFIYFYLVIDGLCGLEWVDEFFELFRSAWSISDFNQVLKLCRTVNMPQLWAESCKAALKRASQVYLKEATWTPTQHFFILFALNRNFNGNFLAMKVKYETMSVLSLWALVSSSSSGVLLWCLWQLPTTDKAPLLDRETTPHQNGNWFVPWRLPSECGSSHLFASAEAVSLATLKAVVSTWCLHLL